MTTLKHRKDILITKIIFKYERDMNDCIFLVEYDGCGDEHKESNAFNENNHYIDLDI